MRRHISGVVAVLMLLAGAQTAIAGNLYRWIDSEGSPVISDRPPPSGTEFETISTRSNIVQNVGENQPPPAQSAAPAEPAAEDAPKEPAEIEVTATNRIYKKNPDYCKRAKDNLEVLELPRIRVVGDDGEGRFLSDEEREEQRKQAREVVAQNC